MKKMKKLLMSLLLVFGLVMIPNLKADVTVDPAAKLKTLTVAGQTVELKDNQIAYEVEVPNETTTINIVAVADTDNGAKLDDATTTLISNTITLDESKDENSYNIVVVNKDDASKTTTYTVKVTKAAAEVKLELTTLTYNGKNVDLSTGKADENGIIEFTINVENSVKEVTVEAKAAAGINITGSIGKLTLNIGENGYYFTLSKDGKSVQYKLSFVRAEAQIVTDLKAELAKEYGKDLLVSSYEYDGKLFVYAETLKTLEDGTEIYQYYKEVEVLEDEELADLLKKVKDSLAKPEEFQISTPEDKVLSKDALEAIKESGVNASVWVNNAVWTFDGSKITDEDEKVDLNIFVGEEVKEEIRTTIEKLLVDKNKGLVIDFSHSGKLPKGTKVSVKVDEKFTEKDVLTLYYYNPKTKRLEVAAKDLKVNEYGYVEFALEHCSSYVLTAASNNAQTGAMNEVFYVVLTICALAGIVVLSKRKAN